MHFTRQQLTGKIRYRAGWFDRLIPEVEVEVCHINQIPPHPESKNGLMTEQKISNERYWRTMKTQDITEVASK